VIRFKKQKDLQVGVWLELPRIPTLGRKRVMVGITQQSKSVLEKRWNALVNLAFNFIIRLLWNMRHVPEKLYLHRFVMGNACLPSVLMGHLP
jgi:hypothetical protein